MTRFSTPRGGRWCAIGIERGKHAGNLGTLWRSAVCLGASYVFIIGDRYKRDAADTVNAPGTVPVFNYNDLDDFAAHRPHGAQLIGVELTSNALPLESFEHPRCAVYLLGPEDGSLSNAAQTMCQSIVSFESRWCLNVAMAGTVLLYDRQAKAIASRSIEVAS